QKYEGRWPEAAALRTIAATATLVTLRLRFDHRRRHRRDAHEDRPGAGRGAVRGRRAPARAARRGRDNLDAGRRDEPAQRRRRAALVGCGAARVDLEVRAVTLL